MFTLHCTRSKTKVSAVRGHVSCNFPDLTLTMIQSKKTICPPALYSIFWTSGTWEVEAIDLISTRLCVYISLHPPPNLPVFLSHHCPSSSLDNTSFIAFLFSLPLALRSLHPHEFLSEHPVHPSLKANSQNPIKVQSPPSCSGCPLPSSAMIPSVL